MKLARFAESRRKLTHALAERHGVTVPADVDRFFDAVASGNWDDIEARFQVINGGDSSAGHAAGRPPGVEKLWPAIIDAYGAAEQAHLWPAQGLLDYGNAALGALRPGMVYVGGTDNGRWIPELLNDTGDGERHIIITQNGLADSSYLDYLNLQFGDQLTTLSAEDSQSAFAAYLADAQKRLEHDQQFPDDPKQIRPGEEVHQVDGKFQVSGMVAVMSINEKLLQALLDKNAGVSFAVQESYPLTGTYGDAVPLGPLMELRAPDPQNAFDTDKAAQTVDYWRALTQEVLADPASSTPAFSSYSHDAVAAGHLLAAHHYDAEAEQTYRLAAQMAPGNVEATTGLAEVLNRTGRGDQARQLLDDFARAYPDQRTAVDTFRGSITISKAGNGP